MGIIKDTLYKISNKKLLLPLKKQSVFPYYHLVRDEKVAHIEHLYPYKNIQQFRKDLEILLQHYKPVSPLDIIKTKEKHNNSFLISFDDGLEEIYSVVYPILKEKNLTAVFFINPAFVDNTIGLYKHYISVIIVHLKQNNNDQNLLETISSIFYFSFSTEAEFVKKLKEVPYSERNKIDEVLRLLNIDSSAYLNKHTPYVSKEQIQQMINDGFYFGGHTLTHPPLDQLSFQQQKREVIESIEWLKMNFGITYSLFAFPFSDKNVSKALLNELFQYDQNILVFGNSGFVSDIDCRIIQRTSFENPRKDIERHIVAENLYKYFTIITGKYYIKRK